MKSISLKSNPQLIVGIQQLHTRFKTRAAINLINRHKSTTHVTWYINSLIRFSCYCTENKANHYTNTCFLNVRFLLPLTNLWISNSACRLFAYRVNWKSLTVAFKHGNFPFPICPVIVSEQIIINTGKEMQNFVRFNTAATNIALHLICFRHTICFKRKRTWHVRNSY